MKQPHRSDEAFLDDVRAGMRRADELHLWWLGQSGFLVQWQGRHLLLDPYLSDSLTVKYAATDKPHVRMTGRVIAPERLELVDAVASTHNHTDHLDAATLIPLMAANPTMAIVVPEANRATVAERIGCETERLTGVDAGGSVTLGVFRISGVPAAHEQFERDESGRHKFLGYVVEVGPWTIYHSGDTVLYDGMVETLCQWRIDVALLPINGRAPERRVSGNLDGREAAHLGHDIGAEIVIPCHYDMFEFNTATPEAFVARCEELGQRYVVLRNGEGWSARRE